MTGARILVSGGAGYIGSHTCKLLSQNHLEPIVYDNLSTGHIDAVKWGPFVRGDILDGDRLREVIRKYRPDAVIHFAGSAYVGESITHPALYYRNNVAGSMSLLEVCVQTGVDRIVFSSTCATYGIAAGLPISEGARQLPINPYGRSKLMVETMLADWASAYGLNYSALRYFNAAGADLDGEIGERHDPEPHLIPRALFAAAGRIPTLTILGSDYDSADGTCVRDYIHVVDLARAHVLAAKHLLSGGASFTVNIGTGKGTSVKEVIQAVERITGLRVPTVIEPRRPGDPPALVANGNAAFAKLNFRPKYSDIDTIVGSAARFTVSAGKSVHHDGRRNR